MDKKLLMIVNPVAGMKRLKPALLDVISIFSAGGFRTTVMVTGRRGDATKFAAAGGDYDLVVCCGGDGTLNETVCGMLDAGVTIPLGYIPCGSTNDFASSMGISSDVKKAAHAIADGMPRPLDVGVEALGELPPLDDRLADEPRPRDPLADSVGVHVRSVGEVKSVHRSFPFSFAFAASARGPQAPRASRPSFSRSPSGGGAFRPSKPPSRASA